jgi:hypothetical protein
MVTFLIGIFVIIIAGAASAFAYLYLADDRGQTGPHSAIFSRVPAGREANASLLFQGGIDAFSIARVLQGQPRLSHPDTNITALSTPSAIDWRTRALEEQARLTWSDCDPKPASERPRTGSCGRAPLSY